MELWIPLTPSELKIVVKHKKNLSDLAIFKGLELKQFKG